MVRAGVPEELMAMIKELRAARDELRRGAGSLGSSVLCWSVDKEREEDGALREERQPRKHLSWEE